jgi:hypothetical protein
MARTKRVGSCWPELLLAMSLVILFVQLFPSVSLSLMSALDLRTWTAASSFVAFAILLFALCAIRFGPEMVNGVREHFMRAGVERAKKKIARSAEMVREQQKESRDLYKRTIEARKRQSF